MQNFFFIEIRDSIGFPHVSTPDNGGLLVLLVGNYLWYLLKVQIWSIKHSSIHVINQLFYFVITATPTTGATLLNNSNIIRPGIDDSAKVANYTVSLYPSRWYPEWASDSRNQLPMQSSPGRKILVKMSYCYYIMLNSYRGRIVQDTLNLAHTWIYDKLGSVYGNKTNKGFHSTYRNRALIRFGIISHKLLF